MLGQDPGSPEDHTGLIAIAMSGASMPAMLSHAPEFMLHDAILVGDLARAKALEPDQATLERPNKQGFCPGQWACGFHGPAFLDHIEALGWMRIDNLDWLRHAALFAISQDNAPALAWLMKKGISCETHIIVKMQWSALSLAAHWLSLQCFDLLIERAADPFCLDRMGHGLVHLLASTKRSAGRMGCANAILEKCIDLGLDVNLGDQINGDTPVALASFSHNLEIIKLLSRHGACLHTQNTSGHGLVHAACQGEASFSSRLVIDYLASVGVDIQPPRGTHPAHFAAARNNPHALASLLENGADMEVPVCEDQSQTPVYTAMCSSSLDALKFLVQAGVRCDVVDRRGVGLLHLACGSQRISQPGMVQVMEQLVKEREVDPDMPNKNRQTPLLHAAQEGSVQAMKTMLALGASPTAVCMQAGNLLHYAAQQNEPEVAILALDVTPSAYLSQPDINGRLPHQLAYHLENDRSGALMEAAWSSGRLQEQTPGAASSSASMRRL